MILAARNKKKNPKVENLGRLGPLNRVFFFRGLRGQQLKEHE